MFHSLGHARSVGPPRSERSAGGRMTNDTEPGEPQAPIPFWRWDWAAASAGTRAYYAYRVALRPLLIVAALLAAWLAVVDTVQQANSALQWRDAEYRKLRSIHAGYELAFVQAQLGVPAVVNEVGTSGFTERVFVRHDHFVQVVSDSAGRVVLYSVTSCDPSFQPTFDAEPATELQLQREPLSEVPVLDAEVAAERATLGGDGTHLFADSLRRLQYQVGVTGSTPENYLEWTGPGSHMTQLRSYFAGVNPLCVGNSQRESLPEQSYTGLLADAPAKLRNFRETFAANTYAETVDPLSPLLSDLGQVLLPLNGSDLGCTREVAGCAAVTVGVYGFGLPPSLAGQGFTRVEAD